MNDNPDKRINIFQSLFQGRRDVFAIRWEKQNKSGYIPAYHYDPYHYRVHKMNGGTFQNYSHKTYLPLTDNEIAKHLNGVQQIGIYPLLQDNTSCFLAADFDKQNWKEEATAFLYSCQGKNISAYLERSRSGNGAHVWIFFDKPYPAVKSRKIFTSILQQSGAFSIFDKSSSFDRLFPNQDSLSGKGLGNLIALPLFKPALENGNSCFIHPETFEPIDDQWNFLQNIQRVATDHLDNLHQLISSGAEKSTSIRSDGKLAITLSNHIRLSRSGLTQPLINFLKEELNFANTDFFVKKQSGRNTYGTTRYFKLVEEFEKEVIIPRGFIGRLIRFCRDSGIAHEFTDDRKLYPAIPFSFNAMLRKHQQQVVDTVSKKDFGVIVAPPGSGKTIIGLKIIAEKKQAALIIVHRKQLLDQWAERIEAFLGMPKRDIGIVGSGKVKIGKHITVATIQSLPKQISEIRTRFGIIIVDECHHVPAETFRNTIEELQTFYLYGLTATPFRKYNDGKIIFTHLGEIIANIQSNEIEDHKQAKIVIRNTELNIPYNSKTDNFETLSKILIHDSNRNKLILEDVMHELNKGKKAVIITERKDHIDTLHLFLKQHYETVTLSGEDSESSRKAKWKIIHEGNFQVLITTGQYFGEGTDLPHVNCLFLAYPFSFQGKLIQYIGRVQRSEINPVIYDYRDIKIDYLNSLFLKRNAFYRKIDKQTTLFDEPKEEAFEAGAVVTIEKKIKVALEDLEFHYGSLVFKYLLSEMNATLEFHIDNNDIRPEFEVLKPYFSKILKSKNISVDIVAEFEYGKLVAKLAVSQDVERINKEIIEGVKFQFLNKIVACGKLPDQNQNIITAEELQHNATVYDDAEDLLKHILNSKQYKHSQYIKFLAEQHESEVMKIRFVLQPFSFVFLLSGEHQYHIILETLDTEEATYVWHTDKSETALFEKIKRIDHELTFIREKGRQAYMETNPQNFSRIVHDYSDNKRGFVVWKGFLEERLF